MSTPRNIVFIIADDWSPMGGCYGHEGIQTPNIDAAAARGTVFDHAYCVTPSCAASRASLMSGLYPHQNGVFGHTHGCHHFRGFERLRGQTLPAILAAAGYATGLIGKNHTAPPDVFPFQHESPGRNQDPANMEAAAEQFLQTVPGDQPFLLWAASSNPHRHGSHFGHVDGDVPYDPETLHLPPWLPDTPETREDLAAYYTAVTRYDACVGRVLDALERTGRGEETLVVITSDHAMPWPGCKASPYDSGHRCPLIVIRPDAEVTGVRSRAMVNWVDLMPTLLDWCGLAVPDHLPGRSFLNVLGEPDPPGWDHTWFAHTFHEITNYFPYRTLHGRRFKYNLLLAHENPMPLPTDLFRSKTWQSVLRRRLTHYGVRPIDAMMHHHREELYDLQLDPHEAVNLAADPRFNAVVRHMRQRVIEFMFQTHDPWLEILIQRGILPVDTEKPRFSD